MLCLMQPVRPPPPGKKYIRCKCNCLMICKAEARRVMCPREYWYVNRLAVMETVVSNINDAGDDYNSNSILQLTVATAADAYKNGF